MVDRRVIGARRATESTRMQGSEAPFPKMRAAGASQNSLSLSIYLSIRLSIYLFLSPNCCRPFIRFRGSRLRASSLRLLARQRSLLKRATSRALPRVPLKDDRLQLILTTAFPELNSEPQCDLYGTDRSSGYREDGGSPRSTNKVIDLRRRRRRRRGRARFWG